MRIISWNVNGLRALYKQGYFDWIVNSPHDVYFLQETKASKEQLPEEIRALPNHETHFASSTIRKGYSGVVTYSKKTFENTIVGLGEKRFDEQGRVLTHIYKSIALVNVYIPNGGGKIADLDYKLEFLDTFLSHVQSLRDDGYGVVIGGDINIAHTEIDLTRSKENKDSIGFLPIERSWIDELITAGFKDGFRALHPNARDAYTYWDLKTRARERNVGWRIDYFFISADLMPRVKKVEIHDEVYGSDHCPVLIEIEE